MGERFHIVGAAGRIDHATEMALFIEDDLDVASEAAREVIAGANDLVEGADL